MLLAHVNDDRIGDPEFEIIEGVLKTGPKFFSEILRAANQFERLELASCLDLMSKRERLKRDNYGRYHLSDRAPAETGVIGEIYWSERGI